MRTEPQIPSLPVATRVGTPAMPSRRARHRALGARPQRKLLAVEVVGAAVVVA